MTYIIVMVKTAVFNYHAWNLKIHSHSVLWHCTAADTNIIPFTCATAKKSKWFDNRLTQDTKKEPFLTLIFFIIFKMP